MLLVLALVSLLVPGVCIQVPFSPTPPPFPANNLLPSLHLPKEWAYVALRPALHSLIPKPSQPNTKPKRKTAWGWRDLIWPGVLTEGGRENCLFNRGPWRSSGEGNGTPLQYSCLENPMDGGAWWAAVHGVAKSRTRLSDFTFTFHFHTLEKEMATRSSVLAWIPGTGEPGGLPSMGSHRVGHDWNDLAAAGQGSRDLLEAYLPRPSVRIQREVRETKCVTRSEQRWGCQG